VCAASTWDAKVNQLVALMGGVIDVNRQQLAAVRCAVYGVCEYRRLC
jgi:hypothetical protein